MRDSDKLKDVEITIDKAEFIDKEGLRCCTICIDGEIRVLYKGNRWFWVRWASCNNFNYIIESKNSEGFIFHHPLLYQLRKKYLEFYFQKVEDVKLSDFHKTSDKINVLALNTNYGKSTLALKSILANPDEGWIYTARETDTLDKFKFDLIAMSDQELTNKIVLIHSEESSDYKTVVDTIKLFESVEMSPTHSLIGALSKYREGNPKEKVSESDIKYLTTEYNVGGKIPIHYRKILLITHVSFSTDPIHFWQGTYDTNSVAKRENLIIDEFTPLHIYLKFTSSMIDRIVDFVTEQEQVKALTSKDKQTQEALNTALDRLKSLTTSNLIDYQTKELIPFEESRLPTFTRLITKQQEFISKDAKNEWIGYIYRGLNELFDADIQIANTLKPKLLGEKSTVFQRIATIKNNSLTLFKERLSYYLSVVLQELHSVTIDPKDNLSYLNVNLLLGWQKNSTGLYDFQKVFLLDATGDLIFNNLTKFNISTNTKIREFELRLKKNEKLLTELKNLTKTRITHSIESLNTYIKECSNSLKEICDEIISECNLLPNSQGEYQLPVLVATIANDEDHISTLVAFDDSVREKKGTNIPKALIKYMFIKYKYKISAVGFNSSKAIGYNGYSDYKYIVIAGEYYHNSHAKRIFNEMTGNVTTDLYWKQRAIEQVVGRIARDGSSFVIYSLLSKGKTNSLLKRLRKETVLSSEEVLLKNVHKTIANKIRILFAEYPDFYKEQYLQVTLDEIFKLIPMTKKKVRDYNSLIKNLDELGYELVIKKGVKRVFSI